MATLARRLDDFCGFNRTGLCVEITTPGPGSACRARVSLQAVRWIDGYHSRQQHLTGDFECNVVASTIGNQTTDSQAFFFYSGLAYYTGLTWGCQVALYK